VGQRITGFVVLELERFFVMAEAAETVRFRCRVFGCLQSHIAKRVQLIIFEDSTVNRERILSAFALASIPQSVLLQARFGLLDANEQDVPLEFNIRMRRNYLPARKQ
jgi:hypothetical protein